MLSTTDVRARLRTHVEALFGERHPISSPDHLSRTETYLVEEFRRLGLTISSHSFEAFGGSYRNVIATMPASASPIQHSSSNVQRLLPPLIIAAHYDTVQGSPGADDNASGLAVMLAVAQSLQAMPLSRPVRFIGFCLEEEDLMGSLAYASHLRDTGQEVYGAIVLECVGYARTEAGSQRTPPGTPIHVPSVGDFLAIVGNIASADLTAAVEGQANRHMSHLKTISLVVPGNGEGLPDVRRSDHAAFWHYGYPAVMLTDTANFRNPHYHRPTDTIDTLDFTFMEHVALGVIAAASHLAGMDKG
nr:M28 family peptidase [Nitrospirota bacterium]